MIILLYVLGLASLTIPLFSLLVIATGEYRFDNPIQGLAAVLSLILLLIFVWAGIQHLVRLFS